MQHLQIPGFENQQIAVEIPNGFGPSRLFVNGQQAQPTSKSRNYLLRRDDGTEVVAQFKGGFPDPAPVLVVGGQTHRIVRPLEWYEWIVGGFPLVLIILGGCIGGAFGAVAATINFQVLRAQMPAIFKYPVCAAITLISVVGYFVIALAIQSQIRPGG